MRYLPLLGLALVACDPPEPAPDASTDARVRVATFNVHRFFDTVCESQSCEPPDDYEAVLTPAGFEARAAEIADAILLLGADVVALQEVETQACLDALVLRLADVMPYAVLGEIHTTASVDVAVFSRTPLDQVIGHRATQPLTRPDGTATTFSRELLEVHVRAANGAKVVVFAAHFRSKSTDDPGRRLAEAQVSSVVVNARAAAEPDALVVLGGDLNDTPGSPPIDALTADGGLVRVADDLPLASQATYRYFGNGQIIDHLMLAPTPAATRVPRSSRVWKDGSGWGGSDHFALTSDFLIAAP
ncbi:MAG: endonuclease/exonuclease/phosphatase family protein [Myxococcales bacterium]|nr:endonuclease/exonuclease/phosphatase family protein [Myxococcales bacterium]